MNKIKLFILFLAAFKDLLKTKILFYLLLPFLLSFFLFGSITYFSWDNLEKFGITIFETSFIQNFSSYLSATPFILFVKSFFLVGLMIPLALISALVFISLFLVPIIVEEVRKLDFPTLIKNSASTFDTTTISFSLSAKYICLWIGTFPLWFFIPGGNILVPFLLLSWFNSRLFSYEVLLELMAKEGAKVFVRNHRLDINLMGLMTSVLYFIPLLNFIAPVITAFAFTRLILSKVGH